MGEMADYTNETGFDAACYEQDVLDSGDMDLAFEMGLVDSFGGIDMRTPPGLIGFMRETRAASKTCRCCGTNGLKWGNVGGKWRLFDGDELHHCPVNPL